MKKLTMLCILFTSISMFCGCASQEDQVEKTIEDTAEKAKNTVDDAAQDSKKTIEPLMDYLKGEKIEIEQEDVIDDIPFAAYDGRSFVMNGQQMYVYCINSEDADMQRLIQQLQADNMVNVERNGQKMQYRGMLHGDYLLLYEPGADADQLEEAIRRYSE